jgi:hypothetical protein
MSYRREREAAARWKDSFDALNRMRTDMGMEARMHADTDRVREQAFNALVTALTQAKMAAPDFLTQLDVDRAARMLLEAFPPERY